MRWLLLTVAGWHCVVLTIAFAMFGVLGIIGAFVTLSLLPLVMTPIGITFAVGAGWLAECCFDESRYRS